MWKGAGRVRGALLHVAKAEGETQYGNISCSCSGDGGDEAGGKHLRRVVGGGRAVRGDGWGWWGQARVKRGS